MGTSNLEPVSQSRGNLDLQLLCEVGVVLWDRAPNLGDLILSLSVGDKPYTSDDQSEILGGNTQKSFSFTILLNVFLSKLNYLHFIDKETEVD